MVARKTYNQWGIEITTWNKGYMEHRNENAR